METEQELLEQEEYEVRIGAFNGPMDLLVYLVQKKEVPLEQISIAEIADQFLKWVNVYSESTSMDLSKAGDFLSMASRLMALKVQELLPAEERDPEMEAEYNEDREALMKEMLEYQRFKQVASGLQEMEGNNFGTYSRGRLEKTQNDDETLADANIWQLFRAYQKSLKTKISETIHHIELDYVTIQDRQQAINNFLSVNGRALFEDLLDNDAHPIVAAVTFMAMLEMIKTDEIVFRQSELFGPIWIYRKKNNADYADEMARETVFFSKDPDVKPGLVEAIRNQALARSKEQTVGDLAAVMREAVQWTESGRNVSEDDLTAMLEGKVDMSDVQENPFAEMMKADDAAEGVVTDSQEQPVVATESVTETPAVISSDESDDDFVPEVVTSADDDEDEIPVVVSATEVSEEPIVATPTQDTAPEPQMTDEEFAEFMRKAQEFYSNGEASAPVIQPDVAPVQQAPVIPEEKSIEENQVEEEVPVVQKAEEPEEDKDDSPFFAGNEMTDEEYIAYLTRSAKNFGKKD
ncbi:MULTISPECIES: ScpA family protein [unclassified Fibrobacter]|uniref:segregation and condensation protein A n=1 Tax=unclassified Fibrobacter TaxID=2634177 RepID=UPI000D6C2810|nr:MULTISPECIES: segregation/condensation protein A [unclassified Fibrobacter]PWJ66233.1 condensin subunit ScpA [Fibrobacter sp. UWR4]PZW69437.1 condensin subunit ScpA [Fibrobacter sp. UWR1]